MRQLTQHLFLREGETHDSQLGIRPRQGGEIHWLNIYAKDESLIALAHALQPKKLNTDSPPLPISLTDVQHLLR